MCHNTYKATGSSIEESFMKYFPPHPGQELPDTRIPKFRHIVNWLL